jgi:CHAT domain-containing protein
MGKIEKAEKFYKKALKKYKALEMADPEAYTLYVAAALNNLGNIYWETGELLKAEEAYTQALEKYEILSEKNPDVYTLYVAGVFHNLGVVYTDRGRYGKAQKAFERAITLREQKALWMDLAETFNSLSRLDDRREDAVRLLELGILFSGEEKYKYAQKGRREEIYMDFLKKTDDPQRMYGILEALRDADLLSLAWDIIVTERVRKNKGYQRALVRKLLNHDVPLNIPRLHLLDNAAFLYIQKMEDSMLYLVATQEKIHLFRGSSEFAHYGKKLLVNLHVQVWGSRFKKDISGIVKKFDTTAEEWTHRLPEEIEVILSEKDTIVFSPDATISYFPLEGLLLDGEPICLSKKVIRATSMHLLQEITARKLVIDSSLIIGNPWPFNDENYLVYPYPSRVEIGCLKEAEEEATMLAEQLPNNKLLLNTSATADRFLKELSHYSVIHFAGHGHEGRVLFLSGPMTEIPPVFEPEEFAQLRKAWRNPNGSPIYMMDEWDLVTDIDILNTPLKKGALVFLNACETGQHKYAGGGHFQGLAQAFLKSGASNVISSLIPLYSTPASEFDISFYDALLSQESVATALQNARKKMKGKCKAHIYWLPYIHYGSLRS